MGNLAHCSRMRIFLAAILFAAASIAGAQSLAPWRGGAAPPLALPDLGGRLHRLEDYRGKVVLINFWATWCEPCRDEMPSLDRLRVSLEGRPFVVLAVNFAEGESRVRRFLDQMPAAFTVLRDADGAASRAWRTRILPATYVVDAEGKPRYQHVGELDWSRAEVRKAIEELLPAAPTPLRAGS